VWRPRFKALWLEHFSFLVFAYKAMGTTFANADVRVDAGCFSLSEWVSLLCSLPCSFWWYRTVSLIVGGLGTIPACIAVRPDTFSMHFFFLLKAYTGYYAMIVCAKFAFERADDWCVNATEWATSYGWHDHRGGGGSQPAFATFREALCPFPPGVCLIFITSS